MSSSLSDVLYLDLTSDSFVRLAEPFSDDNVIRLFSLQLFATYINWAFKMQVIKSCPLNSFFFLN